MAVKQEWMRPASGGQGEVYSCGWTGDRTERVLVIAHGMAEHSARYDGFARFLADRGFAVYLNDHPGHGRSTQPQGHFQDENGWSSTVEDLHALVGQAAGRHPGKPLYLLGHSMGSFLSRSYLTRYGASLSGCVLCGTMGKNPGVPLGLALSRLQCRVKGPRSQGKLLSVLAFAGYNGKITHPVNEFAWLSTVDQVCRDYKADPLCGFPFTAGGYRDLFTGLTEITGPQWARKVPKDLPILLAAGDADPVGAYGKGPTQVAAWLRSAGCTEVDLKLYPGLRHELLNEHCKGQVYQDLLQWLLAH